jgi:hypothetical protein
MSEIQTRPEGDLAPPSPLELMDRAIERGIDPSQLTVLSELHEKLERRADERAFGEALAGFQAECPQIRKTRAAEFKGQHAYSFASLEDIMKEVGPLLKKYGLAISFSVDWDEGRMLATCAVRHGIHSERSTVPVAMPGNVPVNDSQKSGIAIAYAKRYALCAALNVVVCDEDSDANGLGETVTEEQAIELEEMLEASSADQGRFYRWAGVHLMIDLPAAKYERARDLLRQKLREGGSHG